MLISSVFTATSSTAKLSSLINNLTSSNEFTISSDDFVTFIFMLYSDNVDCSTSCKSLLEVSK